MVFKITRYYSILRDCINRTKYSTTETILHSHMIQENRKSSSIIFENASSSSVGGVAGEHRRPVTSDLAAAIYGYHNRSAPLSHSVVEGMGNLICRWDAASNTFNGIDLQTIMKL